MTSDDEHAASPAKEGSLLDVLDDLDGIPIPKAIKRSAFKAIGQLLTSAVGVPVAKLEAIAQGIRTEVKAKSIVSLAAAEAAGQRVRDDPQLADRALLAYGSRIVGEQTNREAVAKAAVAELRELPEPEQEPKEIDDDWLYRFSRYAEGVSNEDMQKLWGRVLAHQVTQPNSFSIRALETLSVMDQGDANTFQYVMNYSYESSFEGSGVLIPYSNDQTYNEELTAWWREQGIWQVIPDLETLGLFYSDGLLGNLTCEHFITDLKITVSGKQFLISRSEDHHPGGDYDFGPHHRITPVGKELRQLITIEPQTEYIDLVLNCIRKGHLIATPINDEQ